jgi:F0F1-type ATP synthase assembly protein I
MVGMILVHPTDAFAYVDPTSGGLLIQLLLGGVAGVAAIARLYWGKIHTVFRRKPKK